MKRLSYNYVKSYFKSQECVLLSNEYKNSHQKLKYICNCGNESIIDFNHFKSGERCKECANKKRKKKLKLSYKDVKSYFESQKCILLSNEYKNSHQKLKYICSCGYKSEITFAHFKSGQRCKKCGIGRSRKTKIKNNQWTPSEKLPEFKVYRRVMISMTEKNYRKYKKLINPNNLPRSRGKYHLDHKYSIYEGFKHNIPPYIISNPHNLQILTEKDNCSKNNKCSITIQDLYSFIF